MFFRKNFRSMKNLLLIPIIVLLFSLQGCSWICRFYITNTSNETITVEMKLMDAVRYFPIFHYGNLRQYKLKKNSKLDFENSKDITADTLEKFSHYKVQVPPHTAIEIGSLMNDHYEKYDQYFINGRTFNLERISIAEKKIEIVPSTFDNYFRKGKYGIVYFVP